MSTWFLRSQGKRLSARCGVILVFGATATVYAYQNPAPKAFDPPLVDSTRCSGIGPGPGNTPDVSICAPNGALRIGGGVSAPIPIAHPQPEYPEDARKAHIEGEVQIRIVVDETGHPKDMRITKKLEPGLDEAALRSVAQWTFKPGMKDGKPVSVIATVAVSFRIPDPPPPAK